MQVQRPNSALPRRNSHANDKSVRKIRKFKSAAQITPVFPGFSAKTSWSVPNFVLTTFETVVRSCDALQDMPLCGRDRR